VKDWGFQKLMKTERPEYHISSPETVFRDIRNVFINVCKHIAKILQVSNARGPFIKKRLTSAGVQEHKGALNFVTDSWTSPNHIAMTVHFKNVGVPILMLLDIVEVAHSHSGFNLAAAFAKILEEFGISDKACNFS